MDGAGLLDFAKEIAGDVVEILDEVETVLKLLENTERIDVGFFSFSQPFFEGPDRSIHGFGPASLEACSNSILMGDLDAHYSRIQRYIPIMKPEFDTHRHFLGSH
jgi:hypothetical protein